MAPGSLGNGLQSPGSESLLGSGVPSLLFSVTLWVVVKPEVLQKATVELLDQSLCASLYGPSLTDRMVCAGYLDGKVDSCQVGFQLSVPLCPLAPGTVKVILNYTESLRPARAT